MRPSEARWIAGQLAAIPASARGPLLNIGSQTADFRERRHPHIDRLIFAPLRAAGVEVVHTDLHAAPGVDLVGDLLDPAVRAAVRARGCKVVLASNLLEHVEARAALARAIADVIAPGGVAIVTVPRSYPYHADPIDTGYRPAPDELAALFPTLAPVRGEVIADTTYGRELLAGGRKSVRMLVGAVHSRDANVTRARRDRLRWLFRPFTTTCVVLRAPGATVTG